MYYILCQVPPQMRQPPDKHHVNQQEVRNNLFSDRSRAIERSVGISVTSSTSGKHAAHNTDGIKASADRNNELDALHNPYSDYDMKTVGFAGLMVLVFFCVFVCVISFVV